MKSKACRFRSPPARPPVVPMSASEPVDSSCLIGCAVLTGAGAVLRTAKVGAGQSVAVFGAGGVAVDLDDRKLQFAGEFGREVR
jgi:Zn-dependent alcohol dehydrogenase